ncbi:MAG TPA: protein phosphatase 2C domain-containing protein [Verrucomicrobiae bacterium]|nr:protein phosphatase 2C domain-containing protein [Verrucomicrobiae bacterium]
MSVRQFASVVRVERGNPELQDCAAVVELDSGLLAVVADGAGGRSNAREAAEAVVRTIRNGANTAALSGTSDCARLLLRADDEALKTGGESTGAFVLLTQTSIMGASVGDSEAWVISEHEITVLTKAQRRKPCLGTGAACPTTFYFPALAGTLLVASDGLFKYTSSDAIANVVRHANLDVAAKELVRLVRYPSGELPDDISIILVR